MQTLSTLDLAPFRRRIRLVRAWRCAAIGACAGAGVSVLLATLDYFGILDATPRLLAAPIILGLLAGIRRAFVERLPDAAVARSVDRRGKLADRLTTASEISPLSGGLAEALSHDAHAKAEALRAGALYPFRLGRWHAGLLALAALCTFVYLLGNTTLFKSPQAKRDAAELKHSAAEVQRVAKPVLEDAKRADASPEQKELARQLNKFASDLNKGRMSKQQALVKANQLADQAQKLEKSRGAALAQSVQAAQTASQKLQAMSNQSGMEKSDAMKLAQKASALQSQIADLQHQLSAAQAGKSSLTPQQKAALAKKLAALQKQLQQIQLSQQAQQFLSSLQNMPDYQEAQKLLAQLAAHAQAQQAGEQSPLTPEQLKQIADRLDQLAKQYNTDAKMRELAKQMLEAARNARLGQGQASAALLVAFGLGAGQKPGMGGLSLGATPGAGGPSPDRWVGAHGSLIKSDKSSLLHVKFADRQISSQIGPKGPESYTEVIGPSTPTGKSSVPYQSVLPQYEKSAESALNKGDVPPQMRTKVRDYFDSLRK